MPLAFPRPDRDRVRPRAVAGAVAVLAIVLAFVPNGPARAQRADPLSPSIERPSERLSPPTLPEIEDAPPAPMLPPIPPPSLGELQGDAPETALRVEEIVFDGNTVLDDETLADAVAPFVGQRLAAEGLEALRRRVTEAYVSRGFVTSGAVLPPQDLASGRLLVRIVEGALERVEVIGIRRYRPGLLEARIGRELDGPLQIATVEDVIRVLDQDPRIDRIDARLRPGTARGRAVLEVSIEEAPPERIELAFANDESPSIGAYAGRLRLGHDNVLGFGDAFQASVVKTEGLTRLAGGWEIPVHPSGTRIFFDGSVGWARLVDNALRRIPIETEESSYGVGLRQKVWHTPSDRVDLGLLIERRRSKTLFDGQGESFVPGPQNGRSEVTALRGILEWVHRGDASVFAFRSMTSYGVDWFNPTTQPGRTPDGRFVSWYGQLRSAHRLGDTGLELGFRTDVQLANRPMLALEQFAIGGPGSVRGYRRNQIVRDQGVSAAVDLRVPVVKRADATTVLAFTPFLDFGYAWNSRRGTPGIRTLSGIGAGLEWNPIPSLQLGVEAAHGFRNAGDSGDLQDRSIYLSATWRLF